MNCSHKTIKDHVPGGIPKKRRSDAQIWECSNCKNRSAWTKNHSSYGNIECSDCCMARIDWVACSDACAEVLKR